jgi:hypothetical protein
MQTLTLKPAADFKIEDPNPSALVAVHPAKADLVA